MTSFSGSIVGGLGLLLSLTLCAMPASADEPAVTGYLTEQSSPRAIRTSADGLTTVTVAAVLIEADGSDVSRPTEAAQDHLRVAHRHGLRVELLVSNWSDELVDFDERAAHRLLASASARRQVVGRLARATRRQGWDGVNIDLELIRAGDATRLVRFARTLRRRLPDQTTVSIDVSARTSLKGYRAGGYYLRPLADIVDLVQVMTYDQHGPWSDPGPVGALPWQRRAIAAARKAVPARRLDLGVAGYGYLWPGEESDRSMRMVTVHQARRIVENDGATARWRPGVGEWTSTLADGSTLWWSDGRSLERRSTVAERRNLHGLALWRLGSTDPVA